MMVCCCDVGIADTGEMHTHWQLSLSSRYVSNS